MKVDAESFVRNLKFETLQGKSVETLRLWVGSVDQKTKDEVTSWIDRARKIKNDENIPRKARREALKNLEASDLVVKFIKALMTKMVDKFPYGTQSIAKAGFSGAGLALSYMSFRRLAVVLFMIRLGLPQFILSDKFEEFADFVHRSFDRYPKSLESDQILQ